MTKETANTTNEDDSSDSDDSSKESRSKKTTKISRSVPLPVSLETESSVGEVTPKPVLSFGERFMQELQKRAARDQERLENSTEEDDDDEEDDDEDETPTPAAPPRRDSSHEPEASREERHDDSRSSTPDVSLHDTRANETSSLEAADWEREPDTTAENVDSSRSAEEPEPVFVDVPLDTPETSNEVVAADVEPELLAAGLGSEAPPEPLEATSDGPIHPEFGPEGRDTMVPVQESAWYNPVAREAGRAEAHNNDDALYRAEKHGLRRGLTAGLLFGWMFGRKGKKHAAEQHKKAIEQKNKEVSTLKNEQLLAQQRIEAMQRTQDSLRANIADKSPAPTLGRENVSQPQAQPAESTPVVQGENISIGDTEALQNKPRLKAAEIVAMAAAEVVAVTEASHGAKTHESAASVTEKPKVSGEIRPSSPEEQEITEETYTTSKDRKVESSAWHRIEIDAKTGRPVLDPEVAYGEEFKREQRQEIWKDKTGDADQKASTGVLGSLATGALSGDSRHADESVYKESPKDDSLHVPVPMSSQEDLHAGNQILKYASSPVIWVVAVTIVVFLFIVGVVL